MNIKKKTSHKIVRMIASVLAIVMFTSTNGSFLVWGVSEGQLNFLGEPAVAQAKVVETAQAITADEVLQDSALPSLLRKNTSKYTKKHWWEFWKVNKVKIEENFTNENYEKKNGWLSKVNPLNWFGGNKDKQITEQEAKDFGLDSGLGEEYYRTWKWQE